MVTYLDFTKRLVLGQLKNTSAVDDADNTLVDASFQEHILSLTNQGLVDISIRLPIIKKRVHLNFQTNKNTYLLDEIGLGDYLENTDDTFTNDSFLSILAVQDSKDKNHLHDTNGDIITPSFNTLRFTNDKMGKLMSIGDNTQILYQAKHDPIIATDTIVLASNLEIALQLFVASLFLSHMNGAEHAATGDKYFGTYLRYIGNDIEQNMSNISEVFDTSEKFIDKGFV